MFFALPTWERRNFRASARVQELSVRVRAAVIWWHRPSSLREMSGSREC